MKTSNYFKNNPKKVKKAMLGLKAFIGAISIAVIFQSPILSSAFLIVGAAIDFIVDLSFNNEKDEN